MFEKIAFCFEESLRIVQKHLEIPAITKKGLRKKRTKTRHIYKDIVTGKSTQFRV